MGPPIPHNSRQGLYELGCGVQSRNPVIFQAASTKLRPASFAL